MLDSPPSPTHQKAAPNPPVSSRRYTVLAGLACSALVAALSTAPTARADDTPRLAASSLSESPRLGQSKHAAPRPAERTWFRAPLAAAYAMPVAAFASAAALTDAHRSTSDVLAVIGLAGFALPPLVRVFHDDPGGGAIGLAGTAAAIATGGIAGGALGLAVCDRDEESDCLGKPIIYAAVGAVTGYIVWAVVDSVFFAYTERAPSVAACADASCGAVTPFVVPLVALEPDSSSRLQGMALGVSAGF